MQSDIRRLGKGAAIALVGRVAGRGLQMIGSVRCMKPIT